MSPSHTPPPTSSWKRLGRTLCYDGGRVKVYEDQVLLPNGIQIDDYLVVEKLDPVYVIALTPANNLVVIDEYKYPADIMTATLPAGTIQAGSEDIIAAARRELAEETGYIGGTAEIIPHAIYDYPTKDLHTIHIVKLTGVVKAGVQSLEESEFLTVREISRSALRTEIRAGKWKTTGTIAALVVAGII